MQRALDTETVFLREIQAGLVELGPGASLQLHFRGDELPATHLQVHLVQCDQGAASHDRRGIGASMGAHTAVRFALEQAPKNDTVAAQQRARDVLDHVPTPPAIMIGLW